MAGDKEKRRKAERERERERERRREELQTPSELREKGGNREL